MITVKEIAGYSNINTAVRYSKPTFEELEEVFNKWGIHVYDYLEKGDTVSSLVLFFVFRPE